MALFNTIHFIKHDHTIKKLLENPQFDYTYFIFHRNRHKATFQFLHYRHAKVGEEKCVKTAGSRVGLYFLGASPLPTRGSGERCKLPQQGMGHSPS